MWYRDNLSYQLTGRGCRDIGADVNAVVRRSGIRTGLCHVFLQHTSASLILCENADPSVLDDLERFMQRLVADGDPLFRHDAEGPDDMPAHVRSVLTGVSITLPVEEGACALGTWQGLLLWEHRHTGRTRQVIVTVNGELY